MDEAKIIELLDEHGIRPTSNRIMLMMALSSRPSIDDEGVGRFGGYHRQVKYLQVIVYVPGATPSTCIARWG